MENYAIQIKGLTEERGQKIASLDVLVAKMSSEKRAFTEDEKKQYEALKAEVESIEQRKSILEEAEKRAKETMKPDVPFVHGAGASDSEGKEKRNMAKDFSWKRALQSRLQGGVLDGVEKEMDTEERKRVMEGGYSEFHANSFMVSPEVFKRDATPDLTAGTDTKGGHTIQTNVESIVDVFLPSMVFGKLPVVRMNNLRGNVKFPQASTLPAASWTTENATAAEKTPVFASLSLSPKRLAAYIQMSNQLLNQSEANIQAYANRFLVNASAIEFEKVCLKGGGSNEPTGIIGGTGYASVYAGDAVNNAANANGARAVWADLVKLVSYTKAVNAPDGQAYITSPSEKGRLQITPRQSSGVEGNFILRDWNSGVNGFPMLSTTNLPDTFTKGTSTALSAIIFGDFSNFVVASWGGMEIGVDPYTNMKEAAVNIVLNSYLDCGMLNPAGFSVCKDVQSY